MFIDFILRVLDLLNTDWPEHLQLLPRGSILPLESYRCQFPSTADHVQVDVEHWVLSEEVVHEEVLKEEAVVEGGQSGGHAEGTFH